MGISMDLGIKWNLKNLIMYKLQIIKTTNSMSSTIMTFYGVKQAYMFLSKFMGMSDLQSQSIFNLEKGEEMKLEDKENLYLFERS